MKSFGLSLRRQSSSSSVATAPTDPDCEQTRLMAALQRRATGDLLSLIEDNEGAIHDRDSDQWTALMYAARFGNLAVATKLIEMGSVADLQAKSTLGFTPLMLAARAAQPKIVQQLLESGAEVDARNENGCTALMLASCSRLHPSRDKPKDLLQVVKLCWKYGANPFMKERHGFDALSLARHYNSQPVVDFLEFIQNHEVPRIIMMELSMDRSVVVALYDVGVRTVKHCGKIRFSDLERHIELPPVWQECLREHFGIPRESRSIMRNMSRMANHSHVSLQRTSMLRGWTRQENEFSFDVFLSHDYGENNATHELVRAIYHELRGNGVKVWFDGVFLRNNIGPEMYDAIEGSRKFAVFVTERYMLKLMANHGAGATARAQGTAASTESQELSYSAKEFHHASQTRKRDNMIPVVLEPQMTTRQWRGPLGGDLGGLGRLYVDFSTPEKRRENFPYFLECIRQN